MYFEQGDSLNNLKNIIKVTSANLTTLIAGVMAGFLLPKFLSVEGYGFYKVFSLYAPYFTLLNLGLIDGIVLKYGDKEYSQLDKENFRAYFRWYIIIHVLFLCILVPLSLFFLNGEYRFIFLFIELNLLAVNITGYLQLISQITQRFLEFSNRKIIQALFNIISIAILGLLFFLNGGDVSYKIYILFYTFINIFLMIWYCFTYRDIIIGHHSKLKITFWDCIGFIKSGFPLVFSYQIATLILSLDRQFVSILFPTTVYATYSFAYSMMALVTTATSAVSAVAFPMFKRMDKRNLLSNYNQYINSLMVVAFGLIIVYFPLGIFINWFLPNYSESMPIFRIILPGIAISSSITAIMHNYYKVLGLNNTYFFKSLLVLAISAIANAVAYCVFKTTISISIASVITMMIWFFIIEYRIRKLCSDIGKNHIFYLFIMILLFYLASSISNYLFGLLVYFVVYLAISFFVNKRTVIAMIERLHG